MENNKASVIIMHALHHKIMISPIFYLEIPLFLHEMSRKQFFFVYVYTKLYVG